MRVLNPDPFIHCKWPKSLCNEMLIFTTNGSGKKMFISGRLRGIDMEGGKTGHRHAKISGFRRFMW